MSSPVTAPTYTESIGARLIAAERQRQMEGEGWNARHDDTHDQGELSRAAVCYALAPEIRNLNTLDRRFIRRKPLVECLWPWAWRWWKPTPTDRVRELVKAGALIAAEIDRLERTGA